MLNYNRYSFSLNFNDEGIFFYTHYERNAEQEIYHVYNARFFFLMHEYGRSAFNEFEKAFVRERQTSINGNLIVQYQQIALSDTEITIVCFLFINTHTT